MHLRPESFAEEHLETNAPLPVHPSGRPLERSVMRERLSASWLPLATIRERKLLDKGLEAESYRYLEGIDNIRVDRRVRSLEHSMRLPTRILSRPCEWMTDRNQTECYQCGSPVERSGPERGHVTHMIRLPYGGCRSRDDSHFSPE